MKGQEDMALESQLNLLFKINLFSVTLSCKFSMKNVWINLEHSHLPTRVIFLES